MRRVGILARRHAHERAEVAHELRLVVVLPVERLAPAARGLEHELREAAQEALAAQQQLGRKAEIAAAQPLERAPVHAEPLAELGDVGDVGIAQRLLAGHDLRLVRHRPIDVPHQEIVDPAGDPIAVAARTLHDVVDRPEQRESLVRRAVDRPIAQRVGRQVDELRPSGRLQPETPDTRAGHAELDRLAGRPVGDERPLRQHLADADAGYRRRALGEAQRRPLGMQPVLDPYAGRTVTDVA